MFMFLLLALLLGPDALLAGVWEFITGFLMPAAAILSSGLLAIWLQRRDHARQAALRHEERATEDAERRAQDKKRAAAEVMQAKTVLIAAASATNDELAEHPRHPEDLDVPAMFRLEQRELQQWRVSLLPDAMHVALWLGQKRKVLVEAYRTPPPEPVTLQTAKSYVARVEDRLLEWRQGRLGAKWFVADAVRLHRTAPTLEQEVAYQGIGTALPWPPEEEEPDATA
jgi:hypothetical protein